MRSTGFGATGRGVLGLASRDKQFAKQLHKDLLALGVSIDDKTGNGHNKWLLSYKDKAEMLIFSKENAPLAPRGAAFLARRHVVAVAHKASPHATWQPEAA